MIDVLVMVAFLVVASLVLLGVTAIADEIDARRAWRNCDRARRERIRAQAREWHKF